MRQILALVLCCGFVTSARGDDQNALDSVTSKTDRVQITDDKASLVSHLQVEVQDGRVALSDVFRAVSRYRGYDDTEFRDVTIGSVPLDGRVTQWTLKAINRVLRPCVEVDADPEGLNIRVDRVSARGWINERKADVRWAWNHLDWRDEPIAYGIERLPSESKQEHLDGDLVVLIHGLNSRPEDMMGLVPIVNQASQAAATFRYPNDQPIEQSAELLVRELGRLADEHPTRPVRLLAHSMGGLVARHALEVAPDAAAIRNVRQLIMIGTPHHGSALAGVATFMDCYEFFSSAHCRRVSVLVDSVSDGLGEATADLTPGSVFLDRLNHCARNPHVRYTNLLGTDGPVSPQEMAHIRDAVRDYSSCNRFVRFASSKLNRALANLDEVVTGKGDGVVSCARGRLDGVPDTLTLPFSHAGILSPQGKASRTAHAAILRRLQQPVAL